MIEREREKERERGYVDVDDVPGSRVHTFSDRRPRRATCDANKLPPPPILNDSPLECASCSG